MGKRVKVLLTSARIRALDAVVDEGSYSAAARRLGMTQPAVSQAVQDLERAFSVQLFERRGRRLVPTDFCLELAPITAEITRLEETAQSLLMRGERMETGILRVGFGNLMPGMALIGAFQKRFPRIQVQAEYGLYSDIMESIVDRRADVGILPNVPGDSRFHQKVCLTQSVVALVPLGHRLAMLEKVSIADLGAERLIFQKRGSATQKVVDSDFAAAGVAPRRRKCAEISCRQNVQSQVNRAAPPR